MKYRLLFFVGVLFSSGLSAKDRLRNPDFEYASIGFGPLFTYPNVGGKYGVEFIQIGFGAGVVVDYRKSFLGVQLRFDNVLHVHDFERDRDMVFDEDSHNIIKPKTDVRYVESPIVFHSMVLKVSLRFYYGSFFVAFEVGLENSYATSEIKKYDKNNDGSLKDTYKSYKHVGKETGLLSYGVKVGLVGYTKKGKIIEIYLGWSNIHLHDAVAKIDTDKYNFTPIKMFGFSSMLELGLTFSFPIVKIKKEFIL